LSSNPRRALALTAGSRLRSRLDLGDPDRPQPCVRHERRIVARRELYSDHRPDGQEHRNRGGEDARLDASCAIAPLTQPRPRDGAGVKALERQMGAMRVLLRQGTLALVARAEGESSRTNMKLGLAGADDLMSRVPSQAVSRGA